jgi:hypothetical protein
MGQTCGAKNSEIYIYHTRMQKGGALIDGAQKLLLPVGVGPMLDGPLTTRAPEAPGDGAPSRQEVKPKSSQMNG